MYERFTDRARQSIVLGQEEARGLKHNYVGTEHLLLGLLNEGEGVAAKALLSLGLSLETIREQVRSVIGIGEATPAGYLPFTPRAKKVQELSLREALQLGHNYIGTEHLLLGLVREGQGVAAQILVKLGAELPRVRSAVIKLLWGYQEHTPQERVEAAQRDYLAAQQRVAAAATALQEAQQRAARQGDPLLTVRREPNRGRIYVRCEDETTSERFWLEVDVQGGSHRVGESIACQVEADYAIVYTPEADS